MHITGGITFYDRRCKTGDFEHKHFSQTFNFSLEEDEDYDDAASRVGVLAVVTVHKMLGLKLDPMQTIELAKQVKTTPIVATAPPAAPPPPPVAPAAPQEKPAIIRERPVVQAAPADFPMGEELPGLGDTTAPAPAPAPAKRPAIKAKPAAKPAADVMDDLIGDAPAPAALITDTDLGKAIRAKAGSYHNKPNVDQARTEIGRIVQSFGLSAIMIPQEKRAEFLRQLDEMQV